jgi:hypothetical protein
MRYKILIFVLAAVVLAAFAWQIEGVTNFTGIQIKATALGTATPLLEIYNQGVGQSLVIRNSSGTPVFNVNANGNLVSGNSRCVQGTQLVTGTGVIAHGLSTPVVAQLTLAENVTGDGNLVSYLNSSGLITASVWTSAATPAAASSVHTVAYYICGTP